MTARKQWHAALAIEVRNWREAKGWTQVDAAVNTGVAQPTISRVERGYGAQAYTLHMLLAHDLPAIMGRVQTRSDVAARTNTNEGA